MLKTNVLKLSFNALVGVKNVIDWLGLKNNHVCDQRSEFRPVVISGTNLGK